VCHSASLKSENDIERITITTHESAIRIIDKKGPLHNPADRDHCLQYMVAIGLIHGNLTAEHYEDEAAKNALIDKLRSKMVVVEDPQFSKDYLDPQKRSIANALEVELKDGSKTPKIIVEYPLGHRKRRKEGMPKLIEKFKANLATRFADEQCKSLIDLSLDLKRLEDMPIHEFMNQWVLSKSE
jgi:2-methylcitrate dehydratase